MYRYLSLLSLFLLPLHTIAQQQLNSCAASKQQSWQRAQRRGTIADAAEDQYDIKYVKLNLSLSDTNTRVAGSVRTKALVTGAAGMPEFVFELDSRLTLDSVKVDNALCALSATGDVRRAALSAPAPPNTLFTAEVFYHGQLPSVSSYFSVGLVNGQRNGTRITYSKGEPFGAKGWWPCKQALQDKIDSLDLWITVDTGVSAGCNGLLQRVTRTGSKDRFEWSHRYPIAYYLVSVAVARYRQETHYLHFTGSSDSLLIQNFLDTATANPRSYEGAAIRGTDTFINFYSGLFGRYPFAGEKYGQCMTPDRNGTMEHQTMTSMGDVSTISHELAHHWFGNNVTCASWKDVWLTEGIGEYAEYLAAAHFGNGASFLSAIHSPALYPRPGDPFAGMSVYVDDTTDPVRIFSSELTYYKGASVMHMLRYLAGNDSLFYHTLRSYQQQYAGGTATTEQFQAVVEQAYGRTMDTFFREWIYGTGWPVYNASFNQVGNRVLVRITQTTTGNQPVFHMPLDVKVRSGSTDTVVRIFIHAAQTDFALPSNGPVRTIIPDPDNWLFRGQSTVSQDTTLLAVPERHPAVAALYPNPAGNRVQISYTIRTDKGAVFELSDAAGRVVLTQPLAGRQGKAAADLQALGSGIYFYRILGEGGVIQAGKLIKQ